MFDLKFFGCGAAFCPSLGNTNAWFVKGSTLWLLDCGESTFEKAVRLVHPEQYEKIYVLLTHMHADHCGSLASLCSYMFFKFDKRVRIVHPSENIVAMLALQGIGRDNYEYFPELPAWESIRCSFLPVKHADDMAAFACLLSDEDETIYYSGDAAELLDAVREAFLAGKISRIYHDTASHLSTFHCWYQLLADAIPPERRKDVHCMHLDGDYAALLTELGFSVVHVME